MPGGSGEPLMGAVGVAIADRACPAGGSPRAVPSGGTPLQAESSNALTPKDATTNAEIHTTQIFQPTGYEDNVELTNII